MAQCIGPWGWQEAAAARRGGRHRALRLVAGRPGRIGARRKFLVLVGLSVVVASGVVPPAAPIAAVEPTEQAGPVDPGSTTAEAGVVDLGQPGAVPAAGVADWLDPSVGLRAVRDLPAPPNEPTELIDQRTRTSRTIANPDGTYSLEMSEGPLHFKDPAGAWQPIDLSLLDTQDGPYGLQVAANAVGTKLGVSDASAGLASASFGGHTVSIRTVGYGPGQRQPDAIRVDFAGLASDPVVTVAPTDDGFEYGAVLDGPGRGRVVHFVLDTGGLTVEVAENGATLVLKLPDGTEVGTLSAPVLLDATETPASADAVDLRILRRDLGTDALSDLSEPGAEPIETEPPADPFGSIILAAATPSASPTASPLESPSPSSTPPPSLVPPSPESSLPPDSQSPLPTPAPTASPEPSTTPSPSPSATPIPSPTPEPSFDPNGVPIPGEAASLAPSELLLDVHDRRWLSQRARARISGHARPGPLHRRGLHRLHVAGRERLIRPLDRLRPSRSVHDRLERHQGRLRHRRPRPLAAAPVLRHVAAAARRRDRHGSRPDAPYQLVRGNARGRNRLGLSGDTAVGPDDDLEPVRRRRRIHHRRRRLGRRPVERRQRHGLRCHLDRPLLVLPDPVGLEAAVRLPREVRDRDERGRRGQLRSLQRRDGRQPAAVPGYLLRDRGEDRIRPHRVRPGRDRDRIARAVPRRHLGPGNDGRR